MLIPYLGKNDVERLSKSELSRKFLCYYSKFAIMKLYLYAISPNISASELRFFNLDLNGR